MAVEAEPRPRASKPTQAYFVPRVLQENRLTMPTTSTAKANGDVDRLVSGVSPTASLKENGRPSNNTGRPRKAVTPPEDGGRRQNGSNGLNEQRLKETRTRDRRSKQSSDGEISPKVRPLFEPPHLRQKNLQQQPSMRIEVNNNTSLRTKHNQRNVTVQPNVIIARTDAPTVSTPTRRVSLFASPPRPSTTSTGGKTQRTPRPQTQPQAQPQNAAAASPHQPEPQVQQLFPKIMMPSGSKPVEEKALVTEVARLSVEERREEPSTANSSSNDCICDRKNTHIACKRCGFECISRLAKRCCLHPNAVQLMDLTACPNALCRSTQLFEVAATGQ